MLSPPPPEYTEGLFFARVRARFEICGVKEGADGATLILRCSGCGQQLSYDWLKKPSNECWTGEFGKRVKQNLNTNRMHRKCRLQIAHRNEAYQLQRLYTENTMPVITNHIQNTVQNIVIVNLPAVTRTGVSGDPLMCSDIPFPDGKTVQALLDNPKTAVPEFVYRRFLMSETPSITAPDPSNTRLKVVHRDKFGNHWMDASLDKTVDTLVYNTLDSLDDTFDAMKHDDYKVWKQREGLTVPVGFDRTVAYQRMQSEVVSALKQHGAPYADDMTCDRRGH
mgnify:CR=1 FL=1